MSHYRKSHRYAKQPTTQRLWLIGSIIAFTIVGLLIINNISSRSASNGTAQVTGAPRIDVVQNTFDYGDVRLGTPVETVFHVRNVGDQPLVILNTPQVQVIEGCCPPRAVLSTKVIQPGQEATITLNFSMHQGMDGKHRFHIDLQTNDPKEPNKQLVVLSNWI